MPSGIPTLTPKPVSESDPIPFDIDSYVDSYTASKAVEDVPIQRNAMADVVNHFTRPFIAQGYNTMASVNRGMAAFATHLDSIADFIEISSGMKSEGLFEKVAKLASDDADHWRKRAEEVGIGFVDEIISEAIGGFVPGVIQFAIDVGSGFTFPYMSGAAEAYKEGESPFEAGMVNAAKTATLSALFRVMHPLKQYLRAPSFGTVFGLEEAANAPEGEKLKGFVKGAAIGAGYSLTSPGGKLGLNEVKATTKQALENLKTTAAGEVAFQKLQEQRGSIPFDKIKKRQRKFLKTIEEAKEIDPTVKEKVKDIEPQDYIVQTNVESFSAAKDRIEREGSDKVLDYLKSDAPIGAEKGAVFQEMIKDSQRRGDFDREVELIELFDKQGRAAGQFIQTAATWTKLISPSGFIRWANKQLEKTQSKYSWADTILRRKPEEFKLNKAEEKLVFEKFREISKIKDAADRADATLELIDMVAAKVPPSVSELIDAYRYQNMLSSPKTQMRNMGENTLNTFITRPMDVATMGALDYVRSSLTGKEREIYVKDAPLYLKTVINTIPNASNAFMEAVKLSRKATIEKPDLGLESKTEFDRARAKQIPTALTLVQRFMEAADKFNMALIGTGEMTRLMKKGVPEAEAYAKGQEVAEKYLYRDKKEEGDPSLSKPAQALNSLTKVLEKSRQLPVIGPLSKWYVPFLRTPMNRAMQMVERSPLGLVRSKFTLDSNAKMLTGAIITGIGATFAATGNTTWSPPANQELKSFFYATGRKPYSVKMGDKWMPLWYLGPAALAFAIPAAIKHFVQDEKHAIVKKEYEKFFDVVQGIAQFLGSQSSTQSIGSLFSALHGDIDYTFSSQTGFTAQQLIPAGSLVRFVNTIIDPVMRHPKGFIEGIEANLPVLSKNIEAHMTPDGQEAVRDPINYFLPYDVGRENLKFESQYQIGLREEGQKAIESALNKLEKQYSEKRITTKEYLQRFMELAVEAPLKNIKR